MSDIVEKTITSLPGLISGTLTGAKKPNPSSRGYQHFVKNLGNLRSRYEEENFVKRELSMQKQHLAQPGISSGQIKECLVRLVYCSMLGHDVSFGYFHAVKLAQQGKLIDKRAGYLVAAMFLKDSDELVMLLVNTIQKDLRSTNVACMCMALTAAARLINQEMVPALLPLVEEKLTHPRQMVRKKAVLCMLAFYNKARDLLAHGHQHVGAALCDSDPGVMWAALHYYYQLVKVDPLLYTSLTPTFISLLQQVLDRTLSSDFEYHGVPAPWLQILLLKILTQLGRKNESTSKLMYPVLRDVLQRIEPSHKIGLAVIYECLVTILSVWPQPALVEHAAKVVGRFISSKNNNLRYLGIKALTMVVLIHPGYAMEHQEAVIDSLEHCDLSIRTRTLDLLYQMANPKNRDVITERLLHHLSTAPDMVTRASVFTKVLLLADRFAGDHCWFIETVNQAVLLGGEAAVLDDIPEKMIGALPKRTEDTEKSRAVYKYVVQTSWTMLHQDGVPCALLQASAWALGEFSGLVGELDLNSVVDRLIEIFLCANLSGCCRGVILSALIKLSCQVQITPGSIARLSQAIQPQQTELRQRFLELERMNKLHSDQCMWNKLKNTMVETQKDWGLSFLDNFVAERLETGVPPYKPAYIRLNPTNMDTGRGGTSLFAGLNFTPYENSPLGGSAQTAGGVGNMISVLGSDGFSQITDSTLTSLQMSGVQRVWTRDGVVPSPDKTETPPIQSDSSQTVDDNLALDETSSEVPETVDADLHRRQMAQLFSGISDAPFHQAGPKS